ncbi:MAG TPA: protein-disulfide reductase DsbD family protein [Prolixibacteraceae bacterium]|nr:protein-disulfide reductase DsbD family protein [Prolixibacteraceae bacterium]
MNKTLKLLPLIIFLFLTFSLSAQVISPVKWSFSVNKISKTEAELVFTADIDKGWHLYSQDIPEGGPIPTTFTIEKGMGFFLTGTVTEPKATEVFDKQFDMKVKYFSAKVEFRQKVRVVSAKPVEVKGVVEYMCCDDEQCLPPNEVPFTFKLEPSK